MGKALPHMRCRLFSLTLSAAVSPTCIPTSLSRSLMVERERSLCERSLAIKVGHFKRGSCLRGGREVQHSRTRACAQYFERSSHMGSPNQCAILSRWVFKCAANGVHSNM
eukprot:scaffold157_cov447-Pavlova_lutheri.AAC.1